MTEMHEQSAGRVWVLTLATFATGTEGYVYAGLLADLAGDLQVTIGRARPVFWLRALRSPTRYWPRHSLR